MTNRPKIRIIHNPTAGGARGRLYGRVVRELADLGCRIEEVPTARRGDAENFAANLAPGACDRLVVAGGDGTINEAANGLGANRAGGGMTPLAILPLGTANVLAAEIGLARAVRPLVRYLRDGEARPVSLGEANGRRFVLMAGIGFDAHAVEGVNGHLKRHTGKLAYAAEMARQFWTFRFPGYRVTVDGQEYAASSAVAANAHYYAGRFVLAPGARLNSPLLEICLFETPGRFAALRYAVAMALGLLPRLADYTVLSGREVEIAGPADDPVQGDGDIIATLPVRIRVLPAALNLVFPPCRTAGD